MLSPLMLWSSASVESNNCVKDKVMKIKIQAEIQPGPAGDISQGVVELNMLAR